MLTALRDSHSPSTAGRTRQYTRTDAVFEIALPRTPGIDGIEPPRRFDLEVAAEAEDGRSLGIPDTVLACRWRVTGRSDAERDVDAAVVSPF